jgi:nucleoside-triphosphatase THEP1
MKNNIELSEKWIKASILGTIWAASEIVLGSFLHNLNVPFNGNILTSIGIIILISVSYLWNEKGLFWRAGLICALMKTMSPSAVIFGPMIAIFSEAVLLEISVRLIGRNIFGYAVGAAFAMSWNLFQKIANFIIFYGFNIVKLYSNLVKFAEKQLNIQFDILWLPILILLLIYIIFGLISAIIGIKTGRKLLLQPTDFKAKHFNNNFEQIKNNSKTEFNYSLIWLWTNVILIIGALFLLNFTAWFVWGIATFGIVTIWAFRYKRALRQLVKPKFWIFFVVITMITAFVFTKLQSNSNTLADGFLIGIQMNFRASVLVVGFSVLGTELYNPKIRNFFSKTYFKQLPPALELSFETLPSIIGNIPDFKSIVKNPVSVIYQITALAEQRFDEIKKKQISDQKIFIITGEIDQGKTTFVRELIRIFKEKNIRVGGIYSAKIIENKTIIGYDVVDIKTGDNTPFLRVTNQENLDKIGKYSIFPEGLQKGIDSLKVSNCIDNQITVIDEVGFLELENRGWSDSIHNLIKSSDTNLILVIRENFTEKLIQKLNIKPTSVYHISENDFKTVGDLIIEQISF